MADQGSYQPQERVITPLKCLSIVRRAHAVEQMDQRVQIRRRQDGYSLGVPAIHWIVELFQQVETLWRDSAKNPSPILCAWSARNKSFPLEAVHQSRDARGLLDHALADSQGRQSIGAGSAQNSQNIVLLRRNAVRLYDLGQAAFDGVGSAQKSESCFLLA